MTKDSGTEHDWKPEAVAVMDRTDYSVEIQSKYIEMVHAWHT